MNIENATAKIDPRVEEAKKLLEDVGFVVSPVQGGDPMARLTRAVEELQEKVFSGHAVDYVQKSNGGGKTITISAICEHLWKAISETERLASCINGRATDIVGYRRDTQSNGLEAEVPMPQFLNEKLMLMIAELERVNNELAIANARLEEGI